jgi:hypothetical protein
MLSRCSQVPQRACPKHKASHQTADWVERSLPCDERIDNGHQHQRAACRIPRRRPEHSRQWKEMQPNDKHGHRQDPGAQSNIRQDVTHDENNDPYAQPARQPPSTATKAVGITRCENLRYAQRSSQTVPNAPSSNAPKARFARIASELAVAVLTLAAGARPLPMSARPSSRRHPY